MEQITTLLNGNYKATLDGVEMTVPEAPGNRHYAMILESIAAGETVTVEERVITIQEVKAEAQRRIYEILPDWKQRNLTARAAELAIKGVENWTLEEQAEVAAGQALWDQIKIIRVKSDELESVNPIPVDYIDNKYWV